MIKINFVKERQKKRPTLKLDWLKLYLVFVVFVFVSIIFSFVSIQKEVQNKKREKELLEQKRSQYIALIKKIEKLKREDKELKNRIQTIIDLKKNRGRLLKVFDEVVLSVPIGKMYLVNLSLSRDKVTITGFALDYENVAVYLRALESKKIFRRADLLYTKQKKIKGYNLVEFKINLEL